MENGQDALIRSLIIKLLAGDGEPELEGVTLTARELTLSLSDPHPGSRPWPGWHRYRLRWPGCGYR